MVRYDIRPPQSHTRRIKRRKTCQFNSFQHSGEFRKAKIWVCGIICCYSHEANLRWFAGMHTYKKFRGRDKVKKSTVWILQLQQQNQPGRQVSHCPRLPSGKSLIIHLQSEALGNSFPKWKRQPKLPTDPTHNLVQLAHHFGNAFIHPFHLSGVRFCAWLVVLLGFVLGILLGFYVWFWLFCFVFFFLLLCCCSWVGFVCLFSFNTALSILRPLRHCLEENIAQITFLGRQIFESKCYNAGRQLWAQQCLRLAAGDWGREGAQDPALGGYNLPWGISWFWAGMWNCPDLSGAEGLIPTLCSPHPLVAHAVTALPPRAAGEPGFVLLLPLQLSISME